MTSLIPARTQSELLEVNRHFYNALWSDARLIEPERFNTWPLVRSLLAPAQRRLEVAPGLRPRLPIEDTQFIDISVAALEKLRSRGGSGTLSSITAMPYGNAGFDLICVFHVVELARRFLGRLALARGRGLLRFPGSRVARPLPAAEHLHAVGDDFGRSALLPLLVLPLARAQGSLDVDLRALLEILARDF